MAKNPYDEEDLEGLDDFYSSRKKASRREEAKEEVKQKMMGYVALGLITVGLFFWLFTKKMYFEAIGVVVLFVIALVVIGAVTKGKG